MSLLSRFGFVSTPAPTWSYETALELAEQRERDRLEDIRRKAEAHEARARAYQRRGGTLGLGRRGVAL